MRCKRKNCKQKITLIQEALGACTHCSKIYCKTHSTPFPQKQTQEFGHSCKTYLKQAKALLKKQQPEPACAVKVAIL